MEGLQDHLTLLYNLPTTHPNLYSALSTLRTTTSYLTNLITANVLPLVSSTLNLTSSPDSSSILSLALLLIILVLSFKILNILLNTILFWVRLFFRLVFWVGVIGLIAWLYTRGAEGVGEDVQHWAGVWRGEYEFWQARAQGAGAGYDAGVGRGGRYGGAGTVGGGGYGRGRRW